MIDQYMRMILIGSAGKPTWKKCLVTWWRFQNWRRMLTPTTPTLTCAQLCRESLIVHNLFVLPRMLPVLALISAALVASSVAMPPNPAPWPDQFTVLFNVSSTELCFEFTEFPIFVFFLFAKLNDWFHDDIDRFALNSSQLQGSSAAFGLVLRLDQQAPVDCSW